MLLDGSKERLILPCACDNTERLVHPSCLIECVNISNFCHCADCHYLFKLELKEDMKQVLYYFLCLSYVLFMIHINFVLFTRTKIIFIVLVYI